MNVDMTRSLAFTLCTTGGGTATAVRKRGSCSERFSHGLENEYRSQIGLETWGDNNDRGDIKVDNKVDNNVWDDTVNRSRIDQGTTDDTVNDTVKRLQTRTRTTTPVEFRSASEAAAVVQGSSANGNDEWFIYDDAGGKVFMKELV